MYTKTIADLVAAIGVSEGTYRNWRKKGCPDEVVGKGYPLTDVIVWREQTIGDRPTPEDDDPELFGGSSPALERYREERAAMVRIERLKLEQELVSVEELIPALDAAGNILRDAAEAIGREFGPIAQERINEALSEIEAKFSEL